jgi:hypothetical protein
MSDEIPWADSPFAHFVIDADLQPWIDALARVQKQLWLAAGLQDPAAAAMHRAYRRRQLARRRRR